jgi:hypothetical protein
MTIRTDYLFPCATFFGHGRVLFGIAALIMQISIFFWPQAVAWAQKFKSGDGLEKVLSELADAHRVPVDPYAVPVKRFRQVV